MIIPNLTYYELLEVSRDATSAEIKRAYRKMAEDYHPDKTMHLGKRLRELANLEMTRINKAKEVLLDTDKRKRYNEYLDGKRTEDLEDIVMEVDPFEEYQEENWEELKEEIYEVEPLEVEEQVQEAEVVSRVPEEQVVHEAAAETEVTTYQPVKKPPASKLPFWERLKFTVNLHDTKPRRGKGRYRSDKSDPTVTRQAYSTGRTEEPEPQPSVITPPPPPPPPPKSPGKRPPSKKPRKGAVKPKDEEIKVNVIIDPSEAPIDWESNPELWDKYPIYAREMEEEKEVHDFEEVDPLLMELVDKEEDISVKDYKHKKREDSRLKGMEPKEEYRFKWTRVHSPSKEERKRKIDELDEKFRTRRKRYIEDKDDMDLEMMEIENVKEKRKDERRKKK